MLHAMFLHSISPMSPGRTGIFWRRGCKETQRKYKHLFRQLEEYCEKKGMRCAEDIGLADLTAFRASWNDGPLSASKKLECLRNVYRLAVKRKWVPENYAVDLALPKLKDNPTLPFSDAEMKAILTAAKKSTRYAAGATYVFILVMRYSGLRISDVTTLKCTDLYGNRLKLRTAKTGTDVSVVLPTAVADLLRKVVSKSPAHFFWTGTSTVPAAVSVWRKRLAEVFEDAGVNGAHSHRFRDSFATALLDAGVSLQDVSTLLGHQSVKITQKHYAPWVKSRQAALDKAVASAAVDAIL